MNYNHWWRNNVMVYIPAECVYHMLYMHAHRGHYVDYGGYVDRIVRYAASDTLSISILQPIGSYVICKDRNALQLAQYYDQCADIFEY